MFNSIRIIDKYNVYFIFKWNNYWVAHVHQGETGANKDLGAGATLFEALQNFEPNVIISLGVAFGIDYKRQNLGDVLVSKRILPYSENKLDEEKLKPDRSQDKTIDKWLHVRLINANGFIEGITYGDILTGGSVLSSYDEKNKICAGYTKSDFIIGGEMEGNALFQFANSNRIPGVVIKGICDWGVAKNSIFPNDSAKEERFKDSLQAYAMGQAVNEVSILLADSQLLAEPKYTDISPFIISYRLNNAFLAISAVLMFLVGVEHIGGVSLSYWRSLSSYPVIWLCMAVFAYLIIMFNLKVCKKIKNQSFYKKIDGKIALLDSERVNK